MYMYILLSIFFASALGILIMVGKRLAAIEDIHIHLMDKGFIHPFVPDLQKLKYSLIYAIKKYGHRGVVIFIWVQVKSTNFIKIRYQDLKSRVIRKSKTEGDEKTEVSKFLKMVSDYKHRIREIKHKIKEEEKSL